MTNRRAYARGVTHIGAMYIAATGVKMWSNGQDTFWGVVKRSNSIPGQGGVTHIGAVYIAATYRGQDVVKWSRHFFGGGQLVKQYSRAYITIDR